MVGINETLRKLFIRLSLAGMASDELLQVYGLLAEDEQLSFDDRIDFSKLGPLKERVEYYLAQDIQRRKEFIENHCIYVLVVGDDFYPEKLALTPNPPVVMYAIGNIELMARPALSVVGARKHTPYGQKMCKKFVGPLAERGLVIVSGLALGIDKLAHIEALDADGDTIAVLGNGILKKGLVLSEYPPFTPPKPFRYPERNRIISALGDGTLVVEAKEQSGSLITARLSAEYGKEVFAICGNLDSIYSRGCNRLILDGAQMVLDVEDIAKDPVFNLKEEKKTVDLSQLSLEEKRLYDSIKNGNQTTESLAVDLGWDMTEILARLTMLELKNYITGVDSQSIELL